MHLLRNKLVISDFLAFPYHRPLPKGQWAVAYVCTTNYHKLILMQATAERAMGGGFRRNSDSEHKLKNRCTGSTKNSIFYVRSHRFAYREKPDCTMSQDR